MVFRRILPLIALLFGLAACALPSNPSQTAAVLGEPLSVSQLKKRLQQLLKSAWTERWRKAPPQKQPVKHPHKAYPKGGHNSVYRLLQEAKLAKRSAAQRSARGPTTPKSPRRKPAAAGGN